ncbi:uncharacterized protein LOC124669538 [Lolium rigidum]|uniref:uncharacterized protein LOC124669538 n=1 Tax=Lolium rigidum TaxID=89674 RepID=UPI001F5C13D8|nr:uncharacterized protein LOC124669538 [Lolium rigidum]
MEFAARGRSTAAVDGVGDGDGRRFSDPPPPNGRDAHSAPENMAALVFRRGELLREFHRERIRLDMILCDLAETERAMTACLAMPAAGWGAWGDMPSMHQSEETLYRNPRSSEETSWWCGNPSEPVIPFYPHVERSPSPVLQQWPVDEAEQQECGSSSRALVVAPSLCPDVEQRWSLRKEPAVEALVQAAINVVANPTETVLFSQKVTPESRAAVNQEQEQQLKDGHGVQLTESGIQRREQPKFLTTAIGQEREEEVKDSHAMQLMECEVQRNGQLNHAAIVQGRETKGNTSHAVQVMESKLQKSEQVKRGAVGQENKAEVKDNHEVLMEMQVMESKFQKGEQVKRGAVGQENKAEVKDNHEVLMGSEIQRTEQPNRAAIGQGRRAKADASHAVQVMDNKFPKSEQVKRGAVGQENKAEVKDNHEVMENKFQKSEQVKRGAIGQERKAEVKDNHEVLMKSEIQRSEQPKHEASGQEHGEEENDRHAAQPMEESGIQSSEQPKPAERTINERIGEPRQLSHRYALAAKEKSPPNEQKRQVFDDTRTQITPSVLKRPIFKPTMITPPAKRHKPLDDWSCTLCQANLTCEEDLTEHKEGELHQSKLAALRARHEASGFDLRNHLRGRSHQESSQALNTEEGGKCAIDRRGEDPKNKFMGNRRFPFCKLCKVECTSQKVMQSHLAGKKHRENLLARH